MGHGRTADVSDREFHFHDMAVATTELMRKLGIERAAIVGGSDGGIVGLHMAIHDAKRVTRLAITGLPLGYRRLHRGVLGVGTRRRPDDLRVSDEYARESPDGADHWPVVIGRLKRIGPPNPTSPTTSCRASMCQPLIIIGDEDIVAPSTRQDVPIDPQGAALCGAARRPLHHAQRDDPRVSCRNQTPSQRSGT